VRVSVRNPRALHGFNTLPTMVGQPPPSSGGDIFTSQHPGRRGMRSRRYSSRRTDRMQRDKFVPIDITVLTIAPLHLSPSGRRMIRSAPAAIYSSGHQPARLRTISQSSGRRNRTVSMAVHRGGHQRVATKSITGRPSGTGRTPAESLRPGSRSRFPFALQSLLPNDFRYAVRP
jgi:hypothetical protein